MSTELYRLALTNTHKRDFLLESSFLFSKLSKRGFPQKMVDFFDVLSFWYRKGNRVVNSVSRANSSSHKIAPFKMKYFDGAELYSFGAVLRQNISLLEKLNDVKFIMC